MTVIGGVLADLTLEQDDLDELAAAPDEQSWNLATAAAPWTIRHQIAHLAHLGEQAARAVSDPDDFATATAAGRTGPLSRFCLVATRRRPLSATHLVKEGDVARRWMEVTQVFAGPVRDRQGGPDEDVGAG